MRCMRLADTREGAYDPRTQQDDMHTFYRVQISPAVSRRCRGLSRLVGGGLLVHQGAHVAQHICGRRQNMFE
jgi:hypothetical protein